MPENRLIEEDVEALRKHTLYIIEKLTCPFTFIGVHEYVKLRDALCSRITLYNARRGGEPSRLKTSHFGDAKSKRWLDNENVEKLPAWEQELFKDQLITYQPGKGTHLVPVLIPLDCVAGLDILCCSDTRKRAKIIKENNYLFPNTGFSADHTSGWNATNKLAKEAGVQRPDLVNATKQRHRISTLYCALDVPEEERQYFYKHMGHSKEVNWGTYQYPLPVMEITKVGKHLQDIDKGMSKQSVGSNAFDNEQMFAQSQTDEDDENYQSGNPSTSDARKTHGTSDQGIQANKCNSGHNRVHPQSKDAKGEHDDLAKSSKNNNDIAGRDYFRWTAEETASIKQAFKNWIEMPSGNTLPGKRLLEEYIKQNNCRFTVSKLRTKIMNEQNKCQRLIKKRLKNMSEKH